jgi:hypothetical protein
VLIEPRETKKDTTRARANALREYLTIQKEDKFNHKEY